MPTENLYKVYKGFQQGGKPYFRVLPGTNVPQGMQESTLQEAQQFIQNYDQYGYADRSELEEIQNQLRIRPVGQVATLSGVQNPLDPKETLQNIEPSRLAEMQKTAQQVQSGDLVQAEPGRFTTPEGLATAKALEIAKPTPQPQVAVGGVLQPQGTPSLMEGSTYTVQPGDTLSGIAKKLGVPMASITGYRSGNPNLIYPGEKLQVAGTQSTQIPSSGQTPATGDSGASGSDLGGDGAGGDSPVIPEAPPFSPKSDSPTDFTEAYTDALEELGVSSIKNQFDKVQKEFDDLQNELNDKISDVNDNPWISEGLRSKQIQSLKNRYEGKLSIKTNQLQLYDSLYQQGVAEAKYLTTGEVASQQWAYEQAQKAYEAEQKILAELLKKNYSNYKELQGGLVDLDTMSWVIPPKATGTTGELSSKQISQAIQLSNSLKSHPAYTDMLDIQTGLQGVLTGLAAENGFGDITAINAFQRMVDPGATVRSEDVVLLQTASGFIDKVLSDYPIEKLREGDKLPQAVRDRMREVAQNLYNTRSGNYNQTVGNQYKQLSAGAGLPFEFIGQDFGSVESLGLQSTGTGGQEQQQLEQIYQEQQQIQPGTTGNTGATDILKNAWNWLTSSWAPKF